MYYLQYRAVLGDGQFGRIGRGYGGWMTRLLALLCYSCCCCMSLAAPAMAQGEKGASLGLN